MQEYHKIKNNLILLPVVGVLIFAVLYVVATYLYPGGSQFDKYQPGFSWANNYWCNLLNDIAINGQPNKAMPVAVTGMFILCITLSLFFLLFPTMNGAGKKLRLFIQMPGTVSMLIALLLFTNVNHDLVTNLASILGLVATAGTYILLYKAGRRKLFTFGLLNILLVVGNNYFYYNKALIVYLPIIQKISFVAFLTWVCCICITLYRISLINRRDA